MLLLYFQLDFAARRLIGPVFYAGHIEHAAAGDAGMGIMVFVRKVDQFLDTALDDGLGAFVAGEQRHVHPRPFQVVVGAVQDGVQYFSFRTFTLPASP